MAAEILLRQTFKSSVYLIAALAIATGQLSRAHAISIRPSPATQQDASIGERIVAFARAQQGRRVGDGECTDLAIEAMKRAGARDVYAYGETSEDGDYIWGDPVALRDAKPGDIVQFRDFTIKTTEIEPNSESQVEESRDHHTAIVEANYGDELLLLEQNVEPNLVVQRTLVPIASGTTEGSPDGTPGVLQTTYEVGGIARVFRPQPARRRRM